MRKIIIGFSTPKNPTAFSKLIRWADGTVYSHVYIKWNWASINRDIIYQASKLAVNFESNITFDSHAEIIEEYEIEIGDECHKQIMQFCMDNSNKPYGVKELFGFGWVKICGFLGKKVHNPFPTYGASFICAKIGYEIFLMATGTAPKESADNIDPLDLNIIINSVGLKKLAVN